MSLQQQDYLKLIEAGESDLFLAMLGQGTIDPEWRDAAGADVDALGSGTTALYWAVAHRQHEVAQVLLEYGADASLSGDDHPSALSWGEQMLDPDLPSLYDQYDPPTL